MTTGATGERPLIALQGACLGYGAEPVLEGVDLEIHAGDFVGLAGANGSGKTTLLRSMLGLLPLRGGRVEGHFPRARLGYVPQNDSLSAWFPLSVWEVAAMGAYGRLRPWQLFPGDERRRVDTALERVGLGPLGRTVFAHLSGGQRQRALIARALTVEPVLLLLDEPFSGVDRESRGDIAQQLVDLNQGSRMTIVLSSHDGEMLDWACKRVIRVSNGGVQQPA